MRNILISLLLIVFISSCVTKENYRFFDLDKAYSTDLSIDLKALQNKITSIKNSNDLPKDTLSYSYARNLLDSIESRIGFISNYENHKKITPGECKEIRTLLYSNLANSIILEDCSNNEKSDFCIEKRNTKQNLENIETEFHTLSLNPSLDELTDMYNKNYITLEELDFLVMNMFLLISINRIENKIK